LPSLAHSEELDLDGFALGAGVACPPGVFLQRDSLVVDTRNRGNLVSLLDLAAQHVKIWKWCQSVHQYSSASGHPGRRGSLS
jgi:hypothetical protein